MNHLYMRQHCPPTLPAEKAFVDPSEGILPPIPDEQ